MKARRGSWSVDVVASLFFLHDVYISKTPVRIALEMLS